MGLSKYTLQFLEGTSEFVLKELLEKYPKAKVLESNNLSISFGSEEKNIEVFRDLYSPTHIGNSNGKILNLSSREWRKGFVSAGMNPSLAYILCMVAQLKKEDILLDPFCGSSVIPITALKYFGIKRVICSDISSKAISMSKKNFEAAEIEDSKYKLFKSDIRNISLTKKNVEKIVSNLPFGIRVGEHNTNIEIYTSLEVLAKKLLRRKGMLVLLTQEKRLLREVFKKEDWSVKSVLRVNEGGLLPEVFVIKRR
ncbi:MAG TPA: methyltransferase [Candidatus Dojkabacteria bacterium]|nr:methyltransferase [Candidatus Dojkabacteria bacterium]HOR06008.1 methyltransferase [Candidatus Dojkabacteria bacterium]HOT60748.1 methyltransferase [Candidatus Dojkabacteria bacterium]HQI92581.1 methyltransferase [Candidatus Dojkabacteria bacterium]